VRIHEDMHPLFAALLCSLTVQSCHGRAILVICSPVVAAVAVVVVWRRGYGRQWSCVVFDMCWGQIGVYFLSLWWGHVELILPMSIVAEYLARLPRNSGPCLSSPGKLGGHSR